MGTPTRAALLIADLEGVAGVDTLEALAFGGEGHAEACARMTDEVNAAIEGLLAQGFTHVRVSDTHRSGSGASSLGRLHSAAELKLVDPDCYGGPLLEGIEAVACVGMHAAGGTEGFAAHTVQPHVAWLLGGRLLSETELAFWLAADLGRKAVFAAGDDVLENAVGGLAAYATTKRALAIDAALAEAGPLERIRAAAQALPVKLARAPAGPLTLKFKTRAQADAAQAAGGKRRTPFECEVKGKSFTGLYRAALEVIAATEPLLASEFDAPPGTRGFAACAARLLRLPF